MAEKEPGLRPKNRFRGAFFCRRPPPPTAFRKPSIYKQLRNCQLSEKKVYWADPQGGLFGPLFLLPSIRITMTAPNQRERILPRLIEDEMKESFIDYSMSVIVSRALPDVRDGLKPVHRRILYAMN